MTDAKDNESGHPGIHGFWDDVRTAPHRCLVLDYDGTLAGFHVDRMRAFPIPGVVDLLERVRDSEGTSLSIMTGRPISELLELLGDLGIPICGSQGTEFRAVDGTIRTHELSDKQEERLRRAEREANDLAREGRVERKLASVALHTRGLDADAARREEAAVCKAWSEDAFEYGLECRSFKGGVELRLAGVDKGTALSWTLEGAPENTLCVYLGDDLTDEDAFRAIDGRGYGIKVGGPEEPTAARGRLADPHAVKEFLETWLRATKAE
ncbi:MAG: trehalose-phosphatase [Candidatus Eisenbacteria bacterium]|nr:trehalose-phosphatase [Candidatus Eisenbacteria bacterium]